MPDPLPPGAYGWSELGQLLHNLWFYFACIVTFALTMLTALAIIPSLVSTGHLPRTALLFRFSMVVTALAFLGLALLLMSYTVNVVRVFDTFWNRFWI